MKQAQHILCILVLLMGCTAITFAKQTAPPPKPVMQETVLKAPVMVSFIERGQWDNTTPEKALQGAYSANMKGDQNWVIETFAPAERQKTKAMVMDKQVWGRNKAYHQNVKKAAIRKKKTYGQYIIFTVTEEHRDGKKMHLNFPFKKVANRWYTTNDLEKDDNFWPIEQNIH